MTTGFLGRYRTPMAIYTVLSATLLSVQHLSSHVMRGEGLRSSGGLRAYLDGWSQFDGPEYEEIARWGYSYAPGTRSTVVWFPLYPTAMRFVERVVGDYVVAGIVVAFAGGLLASIAFWAWLSDRGMTGTVRLTAFAVFALYPYGYYLYGVVYADALFVGLAITAFVLVDRRQLVWGGLVGALATATRPTGLALVPALVVLGLYRDGVLVIPTNPGGIVARFQIPRQIDRTRLRVRSFAPLLAFGGVGSYMAYLWVRWGHPLLFILNEQEYHPEDKPLLKKAFFYKLLHAGDDPTYAITIAGQALVLLAVVLAIPAVCRRFGFAYGLYLGVLVAIPTLSTGDFMGTGRYLMAAFPAAALAGECLAQRPAAVRRAVLGVSGTLMVFMAWGFSRSWYFT